MTAKIKIRLYVIFIEPQKFDTTDKCFTVPVYGDLIIIGYWMYIVKYSARVHMAKDARACECVSAIWTSAEYFTIYIQ